QTAVNPLLGTFGSYGGPTQTLPLQQGSPAIDAANNCPLTDQRGFARNGPCDIGAYEFGGGLVITTINPPFVGLGEGALTLTVSGVGFTATSVVQWDGVPRTTTYVNAETLTATIPAADLDETGSFQVTVYDSERDLLSNAMTFRVVDQVYQIWLPMVRH
ncbi:MAG: IPT/TIG domain-containing protein, partial [Anaerolineales bacterium]|nr:IPT/TIG domain-containing protein [Anaerolineales bacterium]